MKLIDDSAYCSNCYIEHAYGCCEICRIAYCRKCSQDLMTVSARMQMKLMSLMTSSLPSIVCNGCEMILKLRFGYMLERLKEGTDTFGLLQPVLAALREANLRITNPRNHLRIEEIVREMIPG